MRTRPAHRSLGSRARRQTAHRWTTSLALASLLLPSACGDHDPLDPGNWPVVRVEIIPAGLDFHSIEDTARIRAAAYDERGRVRPGAVISWTSGDVSVASVDVQGLVTARGNGVTEVRATSGDASVSAPVTVSQRVASLSLAPDTITLTALGDTAVLRPSALDGHGHAVDAAEYHWTVPENGVVSVATVDGPSVQVVARKPGAVSIVVSGSREGGSASDTVEVRVSPQPHRLALIPRDVEFTALGDSVPLVGAAFDERGHPISNVSLLWTVEDSTVAAVGEDGLVVSRAVGTTIVRARAGLATDSASITVTQVLASVTATPDHIVLSSIGDTTRASAMARDANGHLIQGAAYAWVAGHAAVAEVSFLDRDSARVVARANGRTTLRVAATHRGETRRDSITVEVRQRAATLSITPSSHTYHALGDTLRFTAQAWDARAVPMAVSGAAPGAVWSTSLPSVVAVDSTGLATAAGKGTATVTVSLDGLTARAVASVTQAMAAVSIEPDTVRISALGDTAALGATVRDANGHPIPDAALEWTVLDAGVVDLVESRGASVRVAGTGEGVARIAVTASGLGGPLADTARVVLSLPTPPGVVLIIGDGMGFASLEAARLASGRSRLSMELSYAGQMKTASASHDVTDSGAGATALATGVRTVNGAVGVAPDGSRLQTVLELAESMGMATGLVSTHSIVHATPAAFAAHNLDREDYYDIADQMTASGVDVLLGGGRHFFSPAWRPDGKDLVGDLVARGCQYGERLSAVSAEAAPADDGCVVALLTEDNHMPVLPSRGPVLADMTSLALSVLKDDPDGFFLMIEGAIIDGAQHGNNGELSVLETLDLDGAVAAVLGSLQDRPNTLVVVTADHETGGMSVTVDPDTGDLLFGWTTTNHTARDVPLFAQGIGADGFTGTLLNSDVGRLILSALVRPRGN